MRLDGSMIRIYGFSTLGIVLATVVAAGAIIRTFSDVPRIRYLVPLLGLWAGLLVVAWLATAVYYLIRSRLSQPA